jgi:ATP-binding cassette subfamily B protein
MATTTMQQTTFDLQATVGQKRLRGMWLLMTGFRWSYVGATLCLGIAAVSKTLTYMLLGYTVDDVLARGLTGPLALAAVGFVGLALMEGGATFLGGRLAARTAEGIVLRLRKYLFDHVQRLPFSYHDAMQTGEILQRSTSDVDAIRRFFADQAINAGRIVLLFVINLIAILMVDYRLALASIGVIPFVLVISVLFFRRISQRYEAYQNQDALLSTTLQENLTGVRVVKAFARQEYERNKFEGQNWEKYQLGKRLLSLHALFWPVTDIICGAQMLAGFAVAALMTMEGTITLGTFMTYAGLITWLIWPIRNLGRLIVDMSTGLVSFGRVGEIIREQREPLDEGAYRPAGNLRGEVVFEDISFAYSSPDNGRTNGGQKATSVQEPDNGRTNGGHKAASAQEPDDGRTNGGHKAMTIDPEGLDERVLRDISFAVRPGQAVALLGSTGSGKTTIVNLLPRFYDYTAGHILLDGVELKDYPRHYLRRQIGIVEQEPFLFSRSIRENITYGVDREVSPDEIEAAARAAAIHDVIVGFPDGYGTLIGEKGVTLSGGQKQRVAIARTLLKDPRILILDDSTSSVDTETEGQIRHALEWLMEGRTTFIIAHRIQSVMKADLILVLDHGEIVQRGRHEELLAQDGLYRRIYEIQTRIEAELEEEVSGVGAF